MVVYPIMRLRVHSAWAYVVLWLVYCNVYGAVLYILGENIAHYLRYGK